MRKRPLDWQRFWLCSYYRKKRIEGFVCRNFRHYHWARKFLGGHWELTRDKHTYIKGERIPKGLEPTEDWRCTAVCYREQTNSSPTSVYAVVACDGEPYSPSWLDGRGKNMNENVTAAAQKFARRAAQVLQPVANKVLPLVPPDRINKMGSWAMKHKVQNSLPPGWVVTKCEFTLPDHLSLSLIPPAGTSQEELERMVEKAREALGITPKTKESEEYLNLTDAELRAVMDCARAYLAQPHKPVMIHHLRNAIEKYNVAMAARHSKDICGND